ncbi:membrane-bound serine protease (ClpP class) [Methanocalculus chunghsingensis]|uniref:Membrane-bound serine protease (ClpP class) n=1 Tax=Methanocalculus chunghsingensis TaxID=156457 RepID=A0A8J8B3T4_9EURY|nr:NfeD family protein [Methanocalculus chunghsingensis]MBR1367961.1 membrane-bound serine protease (ClpP class) [Methanocalculus chunghsingensis]
MVLETNLYFALIIIGALLILYEAINPGFFAAVPGTTMIVLGIMFLMGIDVFNTVWGVILGVASALIAASLSVLLYRRLSPEQLPTTLSRDSLIGREGKVIREVGGEEVFGKVLIAGVEWSARSTGRVLSPGTPVRVVSSEGVHVIVEEVQL